MAQTIPWQRVRRVAPSIGILSILCLTAYLATSAPGAQADASLQWLHVEDNRIMNESGKIVILRGVNIENREWLWSSNKSLSYERKAIPKATGAPPDGWGANLIVLAVASGSINRGDGIYLGFLDEQVALAKANGAYTLLTYRYAEPNSSQPNMPNSPAQDAMAALAERYANEPAVLYGLQVEPHDVSWSRLKPRFTTMIDAIRDNNPKALISVPGTQWSRYVHWALNSPILRDNLVYNIHYYDPYSAIETQYQLSKVAAVYPIILGEFGAGTSTSLDDVKRLLDRAEALGISWTGWLFNEKGCPCILTDSSTFATTAYGAEIKKRLQAAAPEPPPSELIPLLQTNFDSGTNGFTYQDDPFRSTSQPAYASGSRISSGGFSGGALKVDLGGIDDDDIFGMSGGWQRSFTLAAATKATLSFHYKLSQASDYESDEFSQLLLSLDGKLLGEGGKDYLAQLTGNGNGGGAESTGWQLLELDLGTLAAGEYKLTLGAYNNKKTFANELTDVLIDEVVLSGNAASPTLDHFLYGDKLYWDNWSWRTSVNPDATSPIFAGAESMAVTYTSGWAGLSLHTAALDTAPYSQLKFALHPNGESLPNIQVSLYDTADQAIKQVTLSAYASAAANGWYSISIPLADLGADKTTITRVQLQEASGKAQPTFHLDDLRFTP